MASVAHALTVTLQWDSNNDGVTAGYRVYYRTASGTYQPASGIDVGNVTQFQADLQPGQTYYFAVRAYSSTAVLGPASTELSFTVPIPRCRCRSFDSWPIEPAVNSGFGTIDDASTA